MGKLASYITVENMIIVAVAIMVFVTATMFAEPLLDRSKLSDRMKAIKLHRDELRRQSRSRIRNESPSGLRRTDNSFAKRVVDALQLSKLLADPKVVENLAQAGLRGPRPVNTFYFFRLVTPFVLGSVAAFYIFGLHALKLPGVTGFCAVFVAFVAGFYGPNIYISNLKTKRLEEIVSAFPDALDLLLICVESGMSIDAAVQKVAGEVGTRSIALAEELSLMAAELSYLPERSMAYEALAQRVPYAGLKSVTTAMTQAEKYGTPLGVALRTMAKENREMRVAYAERRASALPAKLTVPMIIFFLPALFIVILGPAYLSATAPSKPSVIQPKGKA